MLKAMPKERKMHCAQCQKGSVLVEFALILPLFLVLLFGVVFFSVALYNKTVLTMATREGARAGAMFVADRTTEAVITGATAATLQACQGNLISFGPAVDCNVPTPTLQDNILTVSATVDYGGLFMFPGLLISAQTSMRLE
jgi:Flp pilus assembly protein TadG